ncbi:MAG: N-acetylmuramic acid 6-phosphate etherase [Verrucomicrobiota bacterium]
MPPQKFAAEKFGSAEARSWRIIADMTRHAAPAPIFLGLEAGATRTVALTDGAMQIRGEFGPANLRLLDDQQLDRHLRSIAQSMPPPTALAIGMAGTRTDADRARILRAAAKAWPGIPCRATNDLETALRAAPEIGGDSTNRIRVLVLSGTGSCCFGHGPKGLTMKVGGWGHILGDKGSGFEIGLRALKAVLFHFDRDGRWPSLGRRLLRALELNEPNDLIGWAHGAQKEQVASLAIEVFGAWKKGDSIANDILEGAIDSLTADAVACAARLGSAGKPVRFILAGSVLLRQPLFAAWLGRELKKRCSNAVVTPLKRESAWGAVEMARDLAAKHLRGTIAKRLPTAREPASIDSIALSPTEQRNPASMNLDRLPIGKAIMLMLNEDEKIPAALLAERRPIEAVVKRIVHSLGKGGRLFYVGAGTSGRLGVLDASECPPTFRTDPEQVQGIIAGGQTAIWSAVEGAEDDAAAGGRAIEFRGVGERDTVVGIAASGRTPFVWGALREAKHRGAATVLLCFNPHLRIPRADRPAIVITPDIGPEILTGSTRLKAGTATKLVLNIFTTLAMVRLGKVRSNLMIDVKASNVKLRDRAVRIVGQLTGAEYSTAEAALKKTDWKISEACARLGTRHGSKSRGDRKAR